MSQKSIQEKLDALKLPEGWSARVSTENPNGTRLLRGGYVYADFADGQISVMGSNNTEVFAEMLTCINLIREALRPTLEERVAAAKVPEGWSLEVDDDRIMVMARGREYALVSSRSITINSGMTHSDYEYMSACILASRECLK